MISLMKESIKFLCNSINSTMYFAEWCVFVVILLCLMFGSVILEMNPNDRKDFLHFCI